LPTWGLVVGRMVGRRTPRKSGGPAYRSDTQTKRKNPL